MLIIYLIVALIIFLPTIIINSMVKKHDSDISSNKRRLLELEKILKNKK